MKTLFRLLLRICHRPKSYKHLLLFALIALHQDIHASHMAGADLTYSYTGGNQYKVSYTLYRDCSGIPAPPDLSGNISSSSCGISLNFNLNKVAGTGTEITYPCPANQTTCSGGTAPGIQEWKYEALINITASCPDWIISLVNCCRNSSISTIADPGTQNIFLEARLNNIAGPNSSPAFTITPVAFLCSNQGSVFNSGVIEPDGDSLVYSLVSPETGPGLHVTYLPPLSGSNPIVSSPAMTINPANGDIHVHPLQTQVSVMAVKVEEFRNGIFTGSVIRDIQVYVQNCNNTLPTLSGMNGTNTFSKVICPGSQVCFDVYSNDPDTGQTLTLTSNQGIIGASFTTSGSVHPTGHFCWTPSESDARKQPFVYTVTVRDNACPSNAVQTYSFTFYVPKITATSSTTPATCHEIHDATASIAVNSGDAPFSYFWTPSGGIGTSASGLAGGNYNIRITDVNGCSLAIPITVNESQPISVSSTVHDASCHISNGSASVQVTGGLAPYHYNWYPTGGTFPSAIQLAAGAYTVNITDAIGCSANASVIVNGGQLSMSVVSSHDAMCEDGEDGSVTVVTSGGQPPLHYQWYPAGGESTTASHLTPGVYTVTVTDHEDCASVMNVRVGFLHDLPRVNLGPDRIACKGQSFSLDAGTGYSNYIWSNNSLDESIEVNETDTYSVMVTDFFGCQNIAAVKVDFVSCTGLAADEDENIVFIFPNPLTDATTISMENPERVPVQLYVTDMLGQLVWSKYVENSPAVRETIDMRNLAAGMYFLSVTRGEHRYTGKLIKE